MTLKNLLVQVDNSNANNNRVGLALRLAQRFGAHLTGCYTIPDLNPIVYADGTALTGVYQEALDAIERDTAAAKTDFLAQATDAKVDHEWLAQHGRNGSNLIESGRYADLCIVGQDNPDDPMESDNGVAENVATGLGRPVLIVPHIGAPDDIGKRVLVAWNATREAARAVSDALPLMVDAERVDVLHMYAHRGEGAEQGTAKQLCTALARNDVKAHPHELLIDDIEVGDALLSRAADFGSDLIVMGAYGHSRFRELVLGGATRDMLGHMTVPVLMAH